MIIYSLIMFIVAAALIVFGVLIYKGNANLVNCYREERVKDKALYCKKISQSLFILADAIACSGIVALFGETTVIVLLALGVLATGAIDPEQYKAYKASLQAEEG